MNKQQTVSAIKTEINRLIAYASENITSLQHSEHPQEKAMSIKNEGYRMALEDMQQFMSSKRLG